jgi:hypothetical protein
LRKTTIAVEDGGGLVVVLPQVQLETVAVFSRIRAVSAAILIHVSVGLHVGVEHGLVDAGVVALAALVGFGAHVVEEMVLEMMLVLRPELALGALQQLVRIDVHAHVPPELDLWKQE